MADIKVFTQSSIRVKGDGLTVYLDPFQMEDEPRDADLVLVTHDHYDHFSPDDLAKVRGPRTTFVVPEGMAAQARTALGPQADVRTVVPGGHYEVGGLSFDTVASYNMSKPFHPKSSGWVGYLLHVGGETIYVSGDMDATPEARAVRCDVALVPIGGTYTMDPREAAAYVNEIAPKLVIPTHYGTIVGRMGDADTFAAAVNPGIRVQVQIR